MIVEILSNSHARDLLVLLTDEHQRLGGIGIGRVGLLGVDAKTEECRRFASRIVMPAWLEISLAGMPPVIDAGANAEAAKPEQKKAE